MAVDLTERDREVLIEALYTAPTTTQTDPQERTALALKINSDVAISGMLGQVNEARVAAAIQTIASVRDLVGVLAEEFGAVVALMERVLPLVLADDEELRPHIEEARRWLLDVKQIGVQLDEMMRVLQE